MTHPVLPKLKVGHRLAPFPNSGVWDARPAVQVDILGQDLNIEKIDPKYLDINCIPDIWARPLLFQMALYTPGHLLRPRIIDEWRGLLAMLALKEFRLLDQLAVRPVTIDASSSISFIETLARVIPRETLSDDTPWDNLYVIMFDRNPIGMTSPTTLVCTAADYMNRIKGVAWFDGQFLVNPVDYLNSTEKAALSSWLEQLKSNLNGHRAGLGPLRVDLFSLLNDFQNDLGGVPGRVFPLSNRGLGMNIGLFSYLDKPIEAVTNGDNESHVRLIPSRQGHPPLTLLVVDKNIPEQWKMKPQDVIVWGTATIANLPFSGIGRDRKRYAGRNLPDNVELRVPEDFFTSKLYVRQQTDAFPGALSPNGIDSIQYQGNPVTPILPIKDELLNYLSVDDLCNRKRIEFKPHPDGIVVELKLPLSGPDDQGRDFNTERLFKFQDGEVVDVTNNPVLEVWPNFSAQNWKAYYTYFSTASQTGIFQATPYAIGDTPADPNDPVRPATRTFRMGNNEIDREITRGIVFPEAMKCKYDNHDAGVLLLKKPEPVPLQNKSWKIGIDLGTTSTNVYVSDGAQEPFPMSFLGTPKDKGRAATDTGRFLQVTASGIQRARMITEFMPGVTQETPFLSIFEDFRDASQSELRSLLDGRIYYVADYSVYRDFNVSAPTIAVDLKWSSDPEDRIRVKVFLEQLCLQSAVEAAAKGVKEIKWVFSYPAAFSVADKQAFGNYWRQISETCSKWTGISLIDNIYSCEPESIASARFFVDYMNASFVVGSVCIDIGGGTSDISIWEDNQLRWQTSLQYAGRNMFLDLLHKNLDFLKTFNVDDDVMEKLRGTLRDKKKFYAMIDGLISFEGQNWLNELTKYSAQDEVKGFIQLIAIGLAGLYYYVGSMLQQLKRDGMYKERMPYVYIAGNGAKMFNWLAEGKYDNQSPVNELFKAILKRASGFDTPPEEFQIQISSIPKAEVAFGLVSQETTLKYRPEQLTEDDVLAGEAFMKDNVKHEWYEKISPEDLAHGLDAEESMERLKDFINTFDAYAKPGNAVQIPIGLDQKLINEIYRRLAAEIRKTKGKEPTEIHVEPPFIIALKILLDIKAEEWKLSGKTQPPSQQPQTPPQARSNTFLEMLPENYNAAVDSTDKMNGFINNYKPVRFGVANAMERRQDLKIEPDFITMNDGDYFALAIEESNDYAVVPRFNLTFEEISYGPGAMGQVFDCPKFDPLVQYSKVKVVKPAIFALDPANQKWRLIERGILNLGNP